VKSTDPGDTPVLITEAEAPYEEQLAARKRKYFIMMGLRFPCLIAAGLCYRWPWVALAFVALSVPLPWMAVLVANDRPPRKVNKVNRYRRENGVPRARPHRVIDG
jgi:hypothetical protein